MHTTHPFNMLDRVHSTQMPMSVPLESVERVISFSPRPLCQSPLTCKPKKIMWGSGVPSRCSALCGGRGGAGLATLHRSLSFVLEVLVEQEVGGQILVLLAGEVGLDHQSF